MSRKHIFHLDERDRLLSLSKTELKEYYKSKIKNKDRIICLECGSDVGIYGLWKHLLSMHKETLDGYYNRFLKEESEHICEHPDCKNITEFGTFPNGYNRYCCKEHSNSDPNKHIKRKDTLLKRYGDINYNNREKSKKTCLELYGNENGGASEIAISKIKKSFEYRNLKLENIKSKNTKMNKYGDENYNNREKSKNTFIQKYGVSNPNKLEYVKEKIRKTVNSDGNFWRYINDIKKNNNYSYENTKYVNMKTNIEIICPIHGSFFQNPWAHIHLNCRCPICSNSEKSRGETKINKYLIDNELNFIQQKSFDGCVDKGRLYFDFYITEYNLCIEYDGIQHFNENNNWYDDGIKRRDNIKDKYCLDNKINLLRIPYWEFNNIEKILGDYINSIIELNKGTKQ